MIAAFIVLVLSPAYFAHGSATWLTKDQLINELMRLCNNHPSTATYESIGKTVLGNDIWLFKFGTNADAKLLIDGATHGHEIPGSHSIYLLAQWLLNGSTEANTVLSRLQILLVPIVNYDQAKIGGTRQNAAGVDLNRNHILGWRNSSRTTSLHYSGPYPASEPETQTMNSLFEREKPKVYVSIHDYGGDPDTNNGNFFSPRYGDEAYTEEINKLHYRYVEITQNMGFEAHGNKPLRPFGSSIDDAYMNGTTLSFLWEQTQTYTSNPETVTYDLIQTQKWQHLKAFTIATAELYGSTPTTTPNSTTTPAPTPNPTPTNTPKPKTTPTNTPTLTPTPTPSLKPPTTTPTATPTNLLERTEVPIEVFYGLSATGIATATIALLALKKRKNNK
jgi:hypothetical protein